MNLIDLIKNNKLDEAKSFILEKLQSIVNSRLHEAKQYIAADIELNEGTVNVVRMGRINRIRRRVRRDSNGKIVVQRNRTRSTLKGYRISGHTIKRISAIQKYRRSQQLKRSWRSSRRGKLTRSLLRRKMSMRRRSSLGI